MGRKKIQILVGTVMLLVWGYWGAHGIPTARLENLVNYPNPFDSRQSRTTISYALLEDTRVTMRIISLLGDEVRSWEFSAGLPGGQQGTNRVFWDGTDESGAKVGAGGYLCQVLAEEARGLVQGIRKIGVIH